MLRILLIVVILLSACAHDPMSKADWKNEGILLAVTAADYAYTLDVAYCPECHSYINDSFLGRHPDEDEVHKKFLSFGALHLATTMMMPKEWRKGWSWFWIGIEAEKVSGSINHDHRLSMGIQIRDNRR